MTVPFCVLPMLGFVAAVVLIQAGGWALHRRRGGPLPSPPDGFQLTPGGVVVGADTRSTSGDIVADKNCMKIHDLAPNMVRI